jgi:heat shock protein HslJ
MRLGGLLLVLVGLVLIAGCGDDEGAASGGASPEGVPWVVSSGLDTPGWEQVAPSATFAKGTVAGSTGCNRFSGSYKLDGDALTVGEVASTQMACEGPGDAVEKEFLSALAGLAGWRVEDGELVLLDSDDGELLRMREASPDGSWTVTAFLQADAVSSPIIGTDITATFGADGTLSGSAGCNTYTAKYTRDQGAITIAEPGSTRKLCSEPAGIMEQEHAYLTALPLARRYEVNGATMTLLTAEGTIVATYTRG